MKVYLTYAENRVLEDIVMANWGEGGYRLGWDDQRVADASASKLKRPVTLTNVGNLRRRLNLRLKKGPGKDRKIKADASHLLTLCTISATLLRIEDLMKPVVVNTDKKSEAEFQWFGGKNV